MPICNVKIFHSHALVHSIPIDRTVVVGRRDPKQKDPPPIQLSQGRDPKLVIADETEVRISRSLFCLTPTGEGRYRIENVHSSLSIDLANDQALSVGETKEFSTEVVIEIGGGLTLQIEPSQEPEGKKRPFWKRPLSEKTTESFRVYSVGAGQGVLQESLAGQSIGAMKTISEFEADDVRGITQMLQLALSAVQKAAGSSEFFQASAEATARIVNLDHAMVLLRNPSRTDQASSGISDVPEGWAIAAEYCTEAPETIVDGIKVHAYQVSSSLLSQVVETSSTVIHDPSAHPAGVEPNSAQSLSTIECAVASPILNRESEVIGVLYGYRSSQADPQGFDSIQDHEATLVEILASSLAGGIARKSQERFRVTLSEFFSPRVTDLLENRPELMEGQDVEVSVLFCDIRKFSAATEILGPKKSFEWINDVMSELSQCVIDSDGVLVDYVGDELFAMWGAPGEQLDHASLSVDAARRMLAAIEVLTQRWEQVLPNRFGAGIGVNTGVARVGNVGSRQKFKYGPLGNSINIASRLQTATKQLGIDCLVSESTATAAGCVRSSRRISKLSVVGIAQPINAYQIVVNPDDRWQSLVQGYQEALSEYEQTNFTSAVKCLGSLMSVFPEDRPSRMLLSRVLHAMDNAGEEFTGIWELQSK